MTEIKKWATHFFSNQVSIYPLVTFRIIFGLMMCYSTLRFINKGWVTDLYVTPKFYFTYYGFDWVKPLNEEGMYFLFYLMVALSIFIAFGLFYRFSAISFFIIFTYVELIDKTNYLNHYYFVSLISFLLVFLPANKYFSLDSYFKICKSHLQVPAWSINSIKLQIIIVYVFAGIAKLNSHWLLDAQPLINWLKHQSDIPVIGGLLTYDFTAYLFSWGGALFDLFIIFFLIHKKTRIAAYGLIILFHVLTAIMFPIGVFPLVMIFSTLIFFSSHFHQSIVQLISKITLKSRSTVIHHFPQYVNSSFLYKILFGIYFTLQLLLPVRYLLYPGKLFWTEQGYRFSWRVMLIEKAGYSQFYVHEAKEDRKLSIDNRVYLTKQQIKMMSTQPDMILQYAQYLSEEYKDSTFTESNGEIISLGKEPKITAKVEVSLFNQGSKPFIDENVNLTKEKRGFNHKSWILPYEN